MSPEKKAEFMFALKNTVASKLKKTYPYTVSIDILNEYNRKRLNNCSCIIENNTLDNKSNY